MKNKALIYIAGLGVLVGLGYFGWKAWRKKHPKGETTPPTPPITDGGTTPSGGGGTTPSGGGGSTTPSNYTTNPFKTKDELLAFQNYVINTKKDTSILGSAGADGFWGQKSASAWDKYGKDYLTSTNVEQLTTNQKLAKLPANLQKYYWNVVKDPLFTDIDSDLFIDYLYKDAQYGGGYKVRDFIRDWSNKLDKHNASEDKQKHTWWRFGNNIYNIFDGLPKPSPFDKKAYVNGSARLYDYPRFTNVSYTAPQSDKTYLGIIKNAVFVRYNNNGKWIGKAFYFIPGGNYQWVTQNSVNVKD